MASDGGQMTGETLIILALLVPVIGAMLIALTHAPSTLIAQCELTFLEREQIDYRLAARQHAAYCNALRECGAEVRTLRVNSGDADGVFIEDTAIVLDELAILASMGAQSRRL